MCNFGRRLQSASVMRFESRNRRLSSASDESCVFKKASSLERLWMNRCCRAELIGWYLLKTYFETHSDSLDGRLRTWSRPRTWQRYRCRRHRTRDVPGSARDNWFKVILKLDIKHLLGWRQGRLKVVFNFWHVSEDLAIEENKRRICSRCNVGQFFGFTSFWHVMFFSKLKTGRTWSCRLWWR